MIGRRLVRARKAKGWTQQQVADKLQISRGTYAHWEIDKREPDFRMISELADLFDVSLDFLAGRTDDPSPVKPLALPESWTRLEQLIDDRDDVRRQLADAVKVTVDIIRQWEAKQAVPDVDQLDEISDFFKVSLDYLRGKSDDPRRVEDILPNEHAAGLS